MANIIAKDGAGDTKYLKATGTGTNVDPFISDHYISSIAAGDNNIGNVDIASIAAGTNLIGKVSIDQVTANANEVVVKSALPAGTNAIGKLSANSGVDIGDVDVLSMPVTHVIADSGTITAVTGITNTVSVKGTGFSIPVTLTVTNGAYAISDVVGGLITLANAVSANGKSAIINTVTLGGVSAIPYELWFLNADIATPAADNAIFTIVAADEAKILGIVPISAIDYNAAYNAFNFATIRGIGLQVKAGASATSIYAYLKATVTTSPGTATLYLNVSGEWID